MSPCEASPETWMAAALLLAIRGRSIWQTERRGQNPALNHSGSSFIGACARAEGRRVRTDTAGRHILPGGKLLSEGRGYQPRVTRNPDFWVKYGRAAMAALIAKRVCAAQHGFGLREGRYLTRSQSRSAILQHPGVPRERVHEPIRWPPVRTAAR